MTHWILVVFLLANGKPLTALPEVFDSEVRCQSEAAKAPKSDYFVMRCLILMSGENTSERDD